MKLSKKILSKEERELLNSGTFTLEELYARKGISVEDTVVNEEKITVLCVRFGNKYGREYVERLRNMVSRNLTIPYEFACLTDDHNQMDGVRLITYPCQPYKALWWHKVHMFDEGLPLKGKVLYFDLDVVICGNIDKLALATGNQFYGIRDFNRKFHGSWKYLNSSVMCWTHGNHKFVYDNFVNDRSVMNRLHGDQDWIWKQAKDQIQFWPDSWIQSYKWEIRSREDLKSRDGKGGFKETAYIAPDKDCCVAVFHGDPKPQDINDPFVVDNWR